MATGKKAASKASKQLRSKTETKSEKTVAGSDLSQAKVAEAKKASKTKLRGQILRSIPLPLALRRVR
jgi:hypothetical protein